MTPRAQLAALERLHTLMSVGLGVAAVLAVGLNLPKPDQTAAQFAAIGLALLAGYGTAYLTDVSMAHLIRNRRRQLAAEARKTGTP